MPSKVLKFKGLVYMLAHLIISAPLSNDGLGSNDVPPAMVPLDMFSSHLFDLPPPKLNPLNFFTAKLFNLPPVLVIDPLDSFVLKLFSLPRPLPNDLQDFFLPDLFDLPLCTKQHSEVID